MHTHQEVAEQGEQHQKKGEAGSVLSLLRLLTPAMMNSAFRTLRRPAE